MVRRDGALQVAGVVTWGGETLGRECGEGPADVSERVLAHLALVTGAPPRDARAVRRAARTRAPDRRGAPLRDRRLASRRRRASPSAGSGATASSAVPARAPGRTRTVSSGRIGCAVIARTAGGWAEEESYNAL